MFAISLVSSLGKEKCRGPSFEQTWIPITQGWFVSRLVKLTRWCWRRWFFSIFVDELSQFHYGLPFKKDVTLIWINWNPLYPRMLCAKFGWNWPCGSRQDENVNNIQIKQDRQTDGRQSIRKAHSSFQLSIANNKKLLACLSMTPLEHIRNMIKNKTNRNWKA